jgi:tetratricopeptide (TPR) repeat protein
MKKINGLTAAVFTLLSILLSAAVSFPETVVPRTTSLAIFPFNDVNNTSLDMSIPSVLYEELSLYEFIKIVPVEVIREKVYEIEPSFLWTGVEGREKRGGILWRIEPSIVEEVNDRVDAQFTVYGEIIRNGNKWTIEAFMAKKGDMRPDRTFRLTGMKGSGLNSKVKEMSVAIADILQREHVLKEAEEDIRQYLGGTYSYSDVIGKMKKHTESVPASIPVRALLLDLYLKDKTQNEKHILIEGQQIIGLMERADDNDTRYLLSLDLDPFDASAEVYEKRQSWEEAIYIRNSALRLFAFKAELHKKNLGRDHYFLARTLEENGINKKALENYTIAVTYLPSSSEYFRPAKDGFNRLK